MSGEQSGISIRAAGANKFILLLCSSVSLFIQNYSTPKKKKKKALNE